MTERALTTTTSGPTSLQFPSGTARVTVDPAAEAATIRLRTTDTEGPSANAINTATADTRNGLHVVVPAVDDGGNVTVVGKTRGAQARSVSFAGNGGVVITGGGQITINGKRYDGGSVTVGTSPIEADITVPPGSTLTFRSTSADLTVTGPLRTLQVNTTSGDIEVGVVGTLAVTSISGDVEATAVTDRLSVSTVSGDVEIGTYGGQHASLSAISGGVALSATPQSSGSLSVSTVSGNIRLRGADHLRPRTSTVSGRVRT